MIVIDASALAKYILKETGWKDVAEHLEKEESIVTLDLALKEVLNAIWKAACIHKLINRSIAIEKYRILLELVENKVIEVENEAKYLDKALEISFNAGITIYDALYIAQALTHKALLLTSDKGQARVAEQLGIRTLNI